MIPTNQSTFDDCTRDTDLCVVLSFELQVFQLDFRFTFPLFPFLTFHNQVISNHDQSKNTVGGFFAVLHSKYTKS